MNQRELQQRELLGWESPLAGEEATIWVPPNVTIVSLLGKRGAPTECVIYPLSDKCIPPIGNSPYERACLRDAIFNLGTFGWQRRTDTTNVLRDFLKLTEATPEMIERFTIQWGPLWLCRRHRDCFWTPPGRKCLWIPAEPLEEFRIRAKQAKAAFDIAESLGEDRPVPKNLWQAHGFSGIEENFNLSDQKFIISSSISRYLNIVGAPSLRVYWKTGKPELRIFAGYGFIRVVWLRIAQTITGAKGLYFCDGCGDPYFRHKRKPQEGRKQFCPDCSEGGRGSRRLCERAKRSRSNSAPTRN